MTLSSVLSLVAAADSQPAGQADVPASEPIALLSEIQLLHSINGPSMNGKPVEVQFSIVGDQLKAHFEVPSKEIVGKEHLLKGEYPYQFDVVELFLSVSGQPAPFPYYEFEVSPYGETFQVRIPGGKKPFQEGIDLGLKAEAHRIGGAWSADLVIPLAPLGFDGDVSKLVGNAFAILGHKPNRSFLSLSLPPQAKPNFHLPEFFRPIFAE